jgi:putative phosphoribosyl transferase
VEVETIFTGFADRAEAGRRLVDSLYHYRRKANTVVVGLPRGGVITAAAIAEALDLPLDVLVVRKLGTPGQVELAMGAIGPGGVRVLNDDVISFCGISAREIEETTENEKRELERRERLYRGDRAPLAFAGKTVILTDDGLATGSTMSAAISIVRRQHPARLVLAVPIAPPDVIERFRIMVDEIAFLETPEPFRAVGYWYTDFSQVTDEEVVRTLAIARNRHGQEIRRPA